MKEVRLLELPARSDAVGGGGKLLVTFIALRRTV